MQAIRKSNGSILILLLLSAWAALWFCMIFFTFNFLLFQNSCAQDRVETLSLSLANLINHNNRIGQLNELEGRSRNLVYASRLRLEKCNEENLEFLQPLCNELLNEARSGNRLIEQERKNQIQVICNEIRSSAELNNVRAEYAGGNKFAALKTNDPQIWRIELGQIKNVQSNIKCDNSIPELFQHDESQGYIMAKSRLFKSGINAKLPGPDSDLDFKFSSLPAYVENSCTPPRNTNASAFVYQGTIYDEKTSQTVSLTEIPSAIRVTCKMNAELAGKHKLAIPISAVAATAGAAGNAGR